MSSATPTVAGIHVIRKLYINRTMDSRFHGNDMWAYIHIFKREIDFNNMGITDN